jgi:GNAT superfamily N-acetyltransferase
MLPDGLVDVPPGKLAAVVTHLQMFRRPAPRAVPPVAVDLVAHDRPDPARYRALFTRVGRDWLWFSRLGLDDAALRAILHDPDVQVFSLRQGGQDLGLLELDFRVAGACELAYFGLAAQLQGQGAGRWLMERALELAWAAPIDRFHVHTCSLDSPAALAFYIRSGFTPYARQVEVADDPRLTGALPRDAAPQVPIL